MTPDVLERTANAPSAGSAALDDLVARLSDACPEAVEALQAVRTASPSMQKLALGTLPLSTRMALIGTEICVDRRNVNGSACELTQLGWAVLERLAPIRAGR